MTVTPDCLQELHQHYILLFLFYGLQSLLGVMSLITACVRPTRVFMSTLLNTLCLSHSSRFCFLSQDNKSDLHGWCHFLPLYNSASFIKLSSWLRVPWHLSTKACNTGAGGHFNGQLFYMPFPDPILHHFSDNINILVLLTIMAALKLWGPALRSHISSFVATTTACCPRLRPLKNTWHATLPTQDLVFVCVTRFQAHRYPHHHLSGWHLSPFHKAQFQQLTAHTPTTHMACPA